jgi:hypothetical protein
MADLQKIPRMMFKEDAELDNDKIKVMLSRSEINVCTNIERSRTSGESVQNFFSVVECMKTNRSNIRMGGIGLRLGGRSSLYDLFWLGTHQQVYAVDVKDDAYVCVMQANNLMKSYIIRTESNAF